MADPPTSDFEFDFDAPSDDEEGGASADPEPDVPEAASGDRRARARDKGEPARRGRGRARAGNDKPKGPASTFDPNKPSDQEKKGRRFGRSRKGDDEDTRREASDGASNGSSSNGSPSSRSRRRSPSSGGKSNGGSRPKLIRAEEARQAREGRADPELDAFDSAFEGPADAGASDVADDLDFGALPERTPDPEPEPEAPSRAPDLADEDLLDSAFDFGDDPPPPREPGGRAGELSRRDAVDDGLADDDLGFDDVSPRRPRSLGGEGHHGNGSKAAPAARSVGGVQLPNLGSIGERIRALKLPEILAPPEREHPGATEREPRAPGMRGLGTGGPRFNLPFNLPFGIGGGDGRRKKGRIKLARLMIILVGLGLLAIVSSFFGMMMAVSSDLPDLENRTEYNASENSVVYDVTGRKLGTLTNNNNRILVESGDIAQNMKQATVAIEDKRFYEHNGVDLQGMTRAVFADLVPGGSTQGASTITQQFVKNALEAQSSRTVFQKFRESALAYHLEKQWDKDKILTQYLNTIYFGEGAYGIEAASRTYFGYNHPDCGTDGHPRCASVLFPEESAMLAGIISSPSAFSPEANPEAALSRRNLVLDNEARQGYITEGDAAIAKQKSLPSSSEIERPSEESLSPYFTSWLRQVLVDRYGPGRAFGGGLRIKTSLDLDLQEAAESAVRNTLGGVTPTSSIVIIDNKTGGIRAMVGGLDYQEHPFNTATNGHRQPGSSFKPFTLITALENGHSAGETYDSRKIDLPVPNSGGKELFHVNNYDDVYYGPSSVTTCTVHSDNSCFAQLGYNIFRGGTSKTIQRSLNAIVDTAHKMGITTDITGGHKANPALILGGLIDGVTPLEMAHAYSTISNGGQKVSGTLASVPGGPVPMLDIKDKEGHTIKGGTNKIRKTREIPEYVATTAKSILAQVVSSGTGKRAAVGESQFGKTGTTDNNGDAWFCGGTAEITACVWVGHADSTEPMETEFGGQPVDGGTFPAIIWAQVVNAYYRIEAEHKAGNSDVSPSSPGGYSPTPSSSAPSTADGEGGGAAGKATPAPAAPSGGGSSGGVGSGL